MFILIYSRFSWVGSRISLTHASCFKWAYFIFKNKCKQTVEKKIGYGHQNRKPAWRPAVWIWPSSIWLIVLVRDKIMRATPSPGSPDQRWDEMGEKRGAMCEFCQAESSPALNSIIWSKTAYMLTTLPVPFCGELQTGWAIQAASCFLCYWSTSNQAAGSLAVFYSFFWWIHPIFLVKVTKKNKKTKLIIRGLPQPPPYEQGQNTMKHTSVMNSNQQDSRDSK